MYKTYFTTLNQTVNKPLKIQEFNVVPVFRIRILRIHRIHMDLQDPDPLVRGMDLDLAPDPSKRVTKYKESRFSKSNKQQKFC